MYRSIIHAGGGDHWVPVECSFKCMEMYAGANIKDNLTRNGEKCETWVMGTLTVMPRAGWEAEPEIH